jgi:twitching motility two-component system response regulator PilH
MEYSSPTSHHSSTAGNVPTPTLLIIDDEVAFLEVLGDACRERGYRVSTATTVDQGIDVAVALQPSVILLDVTMPADSGWRALETLGTHPRTRNIPVIMMSGNLMTGPAPCRATPAAWLDKPFAPAELFHVLDKVLGTGLAASQPK